MEYEALFHIETYKIIIVYFHNMYYAKIRGDWKVLEWRVCSPVYRREKALAEQGPVTDQRGVRCASIWLHLDYELDRSVYC
jgi:hypothetical protein